MDPTSKRSQLHTAHKGVVSTLSLTPLQPPLIYLVCVSVRYQLRVDEVQLRLVSESNRDGGVIDGRRSNARAAEFLTSQTEESTPKDELEARQSIAHCRASLTLACSVWSGIWLLTRMSVVTVCSCSSRVRIANLLPAKSRRVSSTDELMVRAWTSLVDRTCVWCCLQPGQEAPSLCSSWRQAAVTTARSPTCTNQAGKKAVQRLTHCSTNTLDYQWDTARVHVGRCSRLCV